MEESYLEKLDNNEYLCLLCNKRVPRKDNARRHIRLKHMQEEGSHWTCDVCHKGYKNKLVLDDHYRKIHGIYKTVQNWLEIKFNPQILLNLLFFFWINSQVKKKCSSWLHPNAWNLWVLVNGNVLSVGWWEGRKI